MIYVVRSTVKVKKTKANYGLNKAKILNINSIKKYKTKKANDH